jgi:hypothetical protein
MTPAIAWRLLHLFFAFSFVGTLVVAEWNGRAARATADWAQRALLFGIVHAASRIGGLGALLALGVFGNLMSVSLGYRMAHDVWLRAVNGVWLVTVLVMALAALPAAKGLARIARAAAGGGSPEGYERELKRWRLSNVALSLLYLALLVLMVLHWRS